MRINTMIHQTRFFLLQVTDSLEYSVQAHTSMMMKNVSCTFYFISLEILSGKQIAVHKLSFNVLQFYKTTFTTWLYLRKYETMMFFEDCARTFFLSKFFHFEKLHRYLISNS